MGLRKMLMTVRLVTAPSLEKTILKLLVKVADFSLCVTVYDNYCNSHLSEEAVRVIRFREFPICETRLKCIGLVPVGLFNLL